MPNQTIVRTTFGSHIYGTNRPDSDMDYKSIFLPDAEELLLQKPAKHIQNNTKTDTSMRNTKDDIDDEAFSIQLFMKNLLEGQTWALDLLFTPQEFHHLPPSPIWEKIQASKDKFIHSGTSSFVGYCKTQAAKYGLKGGRVKALRLALEFMRSYSNDRMKIMDLPKAHIDQLVADIGEEAEILTLKNPAGVEEPYLSICNRKIGFHSTLHYAIELLQKIFDQYGQRALLAEKNEGVDWKALSHAVRVAHEAKELLLTGKLTFPRPEAELLRKIRLGPDNGGFTYKQVEIMIESGLIEVEAAKEVSKLRKYPDYKFADELIAEIHLDIIRKAFG